jgi:hypothetical protein
VARLEILVACAVVADAAVGGAVAVVVVEVVGSGGGRGCLMTIMM